MRSYIQIHPLMLLVSGAFFRQLKPSSSKRTSGKTQNGQQPVGVAPAVL